MRVGGRPTDPLLLPLLALLTPCLGVALLAAFGGGLAAVLPRALGLGRQGALGLRAKLPAALAATAVAALAVGALGLGLGLARRGPRPVEAVELLWGALERDHDARPLPRGGRACGPRRRRRVELLVDFGLLLEADQVGGLLLLKLEPLRRGEHVPRLLHGGLEVILADLRVLLPHRLARERREEVERRLGAPRLGAPIVDGLELLPLSTDGRCAGLRRRCRHRHQRAALHWHRRMPGHRHLRRVRHLPLRLHRHCLHRHMWQAWHHLRLRQLLRLRLLLVGGDGAAHHRLTGHHGPRQLVRIIVWGGDGTINRHRLAHHGRWHTRRLSHLHSRLRRLGVHRHLRSATSRLGLPQHLRLLPDHVSRRSSSV